MGEKQLEHFHTVVFEVSMRVAVAVVFLSVVVLVTVFLIVLLYIVVWMGDIDSQV